MRLRLSYRNPSFRPLRRWLYRGLAACLLASPALAGTFGTVVPIGGHAADVALDEKRGLLYVANMTGNRVDVISTATKTVLSNRSFNVAPYPASVSLSPDGRFLVVSHYRNSEEPTTWSNIITIYDVQYDVKRTLTLGSAPVGVGFGADNKAFIATMKDFQLLDPGPGTLETIDTVADVTGKFLPVDWATHPPEITRASVAPSGDLQFVWGIAEVGQKEDQEVIFRYNVAAKTVEATYWTSSPPLGPRAMAVNYDGSVCLTGWGLFLRGRVLLAQFRDASGRFNIGGLAIDSKKGPYGTAYAQIDQKAAAATSVRVLLITDADNLTIRERLSLPEHLGGKAVLNADGSVLYAVSDSGVTVLPVGALAQTPRVVAKQEDVVFRGNFCDRRTSTQELEIVDPGGGQTDFSLAVTPPELARGLALSQASGVTPAKVKVTVDPSFFQNYRGTVTAKIEITSRAGVNLPPSVRVLINNREPDQRGTIVNIPGALVDLLADPVRNRFYILRQDRNEVLVIDAANYNHVATFRTGNTPMQLAMTYDRQYLLVGNDDSQIAYVYDLENMRSIGFVAFPPGHYPRSIACSANALLAFSRVAGPHNTIDRIDLGNAFAIALPNLGVWKNEIPTDQTGTTLVTSQSGLKILIVRPDGNVMGYDATNDTFFASRKDFDKLSGAYAALSDNRFVVDKYLLNSSLVRVQDFPTDTGQTSGFAMFDNYGVRTTALSAANPGVIEKVEFGKDTRIRPTRMIEAPLLVQSTTATSPEECQEVFGQTLCKPATTTTITLGPHFTRTLLPLPNRVALISLTTSGYIILPWNYDAALSEPRLERVTNLADGSDNVAPGALVSVAGTNLSLSQYATSGIPLPTILGESCLTVNGIPIPLSLISGTQINAQLPFLLAGDAVMTLRSPAGVSNNLTFTVLPAAPSVFRTTAAIPTVVRAVNGELVTPSNPIHPEDWIVIYATGLGVTSPQVAPGYGAPSDPLAQALIQPEVTLGGEPLGIGYAGLVPGQVGVYQINAYVPYWAPLGWEVPLKITQGGTSTTLNVRVVK